ncbi:siderophore-interacting protein [Kribbella antibiotica]|uniref:Siderophore-interacting protein n=1 Tax=Kribbella antibiotica TaxID=190195 RepID=A0A4R4ZVW3_9ACTN|nr:siderophore-interacting protein [Kribbella antibiotica]TDD62506.1 siderophore-interacting protein [Kribbella antibiotica]
MTAVATPPIMFDSLFVTVQAVEDLSPHLRRVTFVAPRLTDAVVAGPDQRIKILLPPPNGSNLKLLSGEDWYADWCAQPEDERFIMRTYTIRELRAEQGELDIEFVLHGVNGPASAWATDVVPGAEIALLIPFAVDTTSAKGMLNSGVDYVPPSTSKHRVLIADETALPALTGILEQLPADTHATVFAQVPDKRDIRPLPTPGTADITWITTAPDSDTDLPLLEALKSAELPGSVDFAWVAGESSMIKSVRRHLVNVVGLPKPSISFQGYWKRGEAIG